jgi:hypothetical protein
MTETPEPLGKADSTELEVEGAPTPTELPGSTSKIRGQFSTTAFPMETLSGTEDESISVGEQIARQAAEAAE